MPANKKHHFVPRFYLKKFAQNAGKTINIHNIKSARTILGGNLYNQCYRNYLYGEDGECEKVLGLLETASAKVVSHLIDLRVVPRKMSENFLTLLVFVLFQKNRTLAAGEEVNQQMDNFHNSIFIDSIEAEALKSGMTREDLEEVTIRYEHPELAAMGQAAQLIPLTLDLNLKVLEGTSKIEFITSDNPVVFYNPFALGSLKREGSATGLQSKGLQIYLPITSTLALLYYDSGVYKIGDRRKTIVPIDEEGVRSLNLLQLLNSSENVYFQSETMATKVELQAARAAPKRSDIRTGVRTIPNSPTSEIVHFFRKDIEQRVKLPFCKLREQPPNIWEPRTVGPRNPEFSDIYSRFIEEMMEGKWKPSDFGNFLSNLEERR